MKKSSKCILCKQEIKQHHNFYELLCYACGEFNYRKRLQSADLKGMVALVTGARINIGYQVALHLLRAGATVLATTRFPEDAQQRYSQEQDFSEWQSRLHIYGLELRNLSLVEEFTSYVSTQHSRLDIIINNAAQTIRQHREYSDDNVLITGKNQQLPTASLIKDKGNLTQVSFNSWLMKDEDVSVMELLEVHVINALAPFLLNSRLKQLMKQEAHDYKYIINVSSTEGRFSVEDKSWRHPHTNMAKAALNQMTRTCAKEYVKYKILMNAVDPGWVTFQHPQTIVESMQARGVKPPFDFVDAAARICDPIFQGINQQYYPFGKLFKDYQEVVW